MKTLTKAEEQIMQVIWKLGNAFLRDIINELPHPKPHQNTVATILKILVEKEFVGVNVVGRNHEYYSLVNKETYSKGSMKSLVKKYFDGSFTNAVSSMVKENNLTVEELELLLKQLKKTKQIFMITLVWYLLKVIICSGILCGYYYLALRNKIFNRWNRFYLLASVVLALSLPLIKINIFRYTTEDKGTVIRMLQTINNSDEIIIEYSRHSGIQFTTENLIIAGYLFITILFLTPLFLSFYKIYQLRKKYPAVKMKEVNFIATDAKGTPFSFFKFIFWNNAIDLDSLQGQQIFNHEIAHVKERHSYDKIFMNLVLLFFWGNPFFWLIQKELYMIHEFIADKEALEDNDLNSFAVMVLQTVYPNHHFSITNNFFHSPLKRRLMMFSKNKNPKVNYLSRLLVLPLAAMNSCIIY